MSDLVDANPLAGNPLRTRADLQRAVRELVAPLLPHVSPGGARIRLASFTADFPAADADLEGFSRPLWGLAPLAAGGGAFDHWDLWRRGLASGSDPAHAECWHRYEGTAQTMVEQAAIGVALALVPEELWEPLEPAARRNLVDWLSRINRHPPVPNNWQFFRVLVNLGLERVGAPIDAEALETSLEMLESFHLGGERGDDRGHGWYEDGRGGARDHYIGWAFHVYGLIYARLRPDDARSAVFRRRARAFARDFEAWFDPRGGVVPFGRSLTYRFAAAGFWSALVFADEEALPWGRVKGLLLRHLRWWSAHPIADRDGVLNLGWTYANPWMRESYNSACSPYWSMKAFLCLAAAEDHPFWRAEEAPLEPLPVAPQPAPGMLLSRDATQSVALNGAHSTLHHFGQGAAKYGRLAYSSVFAFSTESRFWGNPVPGDSCLVFARPGERPRLRRQVESHLLRDDLLYSRWSPMEGVCVHTVLWGRTPWHLRLHRIVTSLEVDTEETGFAVGSAEGPEWESEQGDGWVRLVAPSGVSMIRALVSAREAQVQLLPANASLVHPVAAVPLLARTLEAGTHDLACAVYASDRADPELESRIPEIPNAAVALLEEASREGVA